MKTKNLNLPYWAGRLLIASILLYLYDNIRIPVCHCSPFFSSPFNAALFLLLMVGSTLLYPPLKVNGKWNAQILVLLVVQHVLVMAGMRWGWQQLTWKAALIPDIYWIGVWVVSLVVAYIKSNQQTGDENNNLPPVANIVQAPLPVVPAPQPPAVVAPAVPQVLSGSQLAELAVTQNESVLKQQFANILSVSNAVSRLADGSSGYVVAIYLKDDQVQGIPDQLNVTMSDGAIQTVPTEIITNTGEGALHINQLDRLNDVASGGWGSVCCKVLYGDTEAIVTSGHLVTNGNQTNLGGVLGDTSGKRVTVNGTGGGEWIFQQISNRSDLALFRPDTNDADTQTITFPAGHYTIGDADVKTPAPNLSLVSNASGTRTAFLLDYNVAFPVPYADGVQNKTGLMLVGNNNERNLSVTVSAAGDSGGCVYHTTSGKLVGIILGGNDKFTWVLPLEQICNEWNFNLI